MKNNLLYLFILMAMVVFPFTSCEKNEEPKVEEDLHDPNSDADQTRIAGYDALEWLQGSLVVVDENDEVLRRIYGKPLDESQPDVISVPVADYDTAKEIFLSWVAPGKSANKVDGGYDYNLTDADGQDHGSVSFRAVEDGSGVLARMSVEEGTELKLISEVEFIDSELWPENAYYPIYEAGKTYVLYDYELKWTEIGSVDGKEFNYDGVEYNPLTFYCIQGNTGGNEGILVWLCPDTNDSEVHPRPYYYIRDKAYNYLPTVVESQKVLDFFNSNLAFWNKMLKEMDDRDYDWSYKYGIWTTGNDEFLLNEYNSESKMIKCLDLDQDDDDGVLGHICDVKSSTGHKYRYMHIHVVPAVN